ncbi:MAG: hypothetical protein HC809_07415, partial [Gammaproteobacteria bacterium]|nr:hypothetical protein [Gammaproteobacteria bacterium]
LLSRRNDGVLRVKQVRKERGVVLLALPLAFTEESWAQFQPANTGLCP